MSRRAAALAAGAALAACGGPDAAPVDAAVDAVPALEQVADSLPLGLSARTTYPDGAPLDRRWRIVDDCRVCMVGTLGVKCARRAGCARDVCVLTDGTELAAGARVDTTERTAACPLTADLPGC